jgi:hypothetical protein
VDALVGLAHPLAGVFFKEDGTSYPRSTIADGSR